MSKIISNNKAVAEFVRSLGFDPSTTNRIVVDIPAGDVVTVKVTSYVTEENLSSLKDMLKSLEEKEKRYDVTTLNRIGDKIADVTGIVATTKTFHKRIADE